MHKNPVTVQCAKYDLYVCPGLKAAPVNHSYQISTAHFCMQTSKTKNRSVCINRKVNKNQFRVTPYSVQNL